MRINPYLGKDTRERVLLQPPPLRSGLVTDAPGGLKIIRPLVVAIPVHIDLSSLSVKVTPGHPRSPPKPTDPHKHQGEARQTDSGHRPESAEPCDTPVEPDGMGGKPFNFLGVPVFFDDRPDTP